jgi:hypothetical protein
MANNILFVFEGERTEKQITKSLTQYFINENTIVQCAYCAEIYQLYRQISNDEDLDTFELLKQIPQNAYLLQAYQRDDFAEIYMFFDYDGHSSIADDEKLKEALAFFNEETEFGRLFISYPMVEALKHFSDSMDFMNLKVKAKENISYKQIVDKESNNDLKQVTKYSKTVWIQLIELHLKKMNYISNGNNKLPTNLITQSEIFLNQLDKYICKDLTVAVLSSFPIFIFDYYGIDYILKLVSEKK